MKLFGRVFHPAHTWEAWRAYLTALFGLPLADRQLALYREHTGRQEPPQAPAKESWLVCGRRSGKSRVAALIAIFLACFGDYTRVLAPGEVGVVMLLAGDRKQARVLVRYIVGLLEAVPMLRAMVAARTAETVTLTNRIVIEIHTASFRVVRGYPIVAAICDEIAFSRDETSANPDAEVLDAIRPAMATVPGALLLCISSPYARRGAVWTAFRDHFAREGDPILVWQADTLSMNR